MSGLSRCFRNRISSDSQEDRETCGLSSYNLSNWYHHNEDLHPLEASLPTHLLIKISLSLSPLFIKVWWQLFLGLTNLLRIRESLPKMLEGRAKSFPHNLSLFEQTGSKLTHRVREEYKYIDKIR